jgi:hypothetical protein
MCVVNSEYGQTAAIDSDLMSFYDCRVSQGCHKNPIYTAGFPSAT